MKELEKFTLLKKFRLEVTFLSGGGACCCCFCDSVIRLIPGVLNDETSALSDSFQMIYYHHQFTLAQQITKDIKCRCVIKWCTKEIEKWRYEQSLSRTQTRRPDLLRDNQES